MKAKSRLASLLVERRKAKKLNQDDLEQYGIPLVTIRSWEQARRVPNLPLAYKLSQVLGVSVDEMAAAAAADAADKETAEEEAG